MRTDPPKHFFLFTGQLRSRWRLCRLTDAAYPLRVRRICFRLRAAASGGWLRHASADAVFLMSQTGAPAAPRAVGEEAQRRE